MPTVSFRRDRLFAALDETYSNSHSILPISFFLVIYVAAYFSFLTISVQEEFEELCFKFGIELDDVEFSRDPVLHPLTARPDHVERALSAFYHDTMTILQPQGKELDLLIVILPDNDGSLYDDQKQICETGLGFINGKVGGRDTVLVDALSRRIPLVSDRPTIIFSADVTHPHPGEDSSPSIAVCCQALTLQNSVTTDNQDYMEYYHPQSNQIDICLLPNTTPQSESMKKSTKDHNGKATIPMRKLMMEVWEFAREDTNRVTFSLKVGLACLLVSLLILIQAPYQVFGTNFILEKVAFNFVSLASASAFALVAALSFYFHFKEASF
ncbi:hypothetical protein ZIOFF_069369 [Zingiber officinale]|uniref:Uncharacterized protein n=1 Tax=Zingiber officinale TaxID=94328 RepID=A0A8J5BGW4_ZINOF|nr:hypothetical protein ZIOFF_069369 [Zingiber officinale]